MPNAPSGASGPYEVLRLPEFRRYVAARLLTTLGQQVFALAVAWQVFELTKDPLALGLIGLAEVVPAVGLALFAGHVTDRSDPRGLVLLSLSMSGLVAVFLLGANLDLVTVEDDARVLLIYAGTFVIGVSRAFYAASLFSLFAQVVPRVHLPRASAWNAGVWQVAAAAGPALGGLIYAFAGPRGAFLAASLLIAGAVYLMAGIPSRGAPRREVPETFLHSLTVGLRFVFGRPVVLSALALDLFAVLFGGAVALLPIFADRLGVGPAGLGALRAAPSVGAFLMAFWLAHHPPGPRAGPSMLWAVAGFGACWIVFALSESFALSLSLLVVSGALDNVSVVIRSTILQLLTPDAMRGRVSAVNSIFISSSNELGMFESGLTAAWFGTVPAVLVGGCLTLGVVLVVSRLCPSLRRLDLSSVHDPAADAFS